MNCNAVLSIFLALVFSTNVLANDPEQGDIHLPGYSQLGISTKLMRLSSDYTVLDEAQYHRNFLDTRNKIQSLITALQRRSFRHSDEQVIFIARQLADIPYFFTGAMGEGDWQTNSSTYQPGAVHVKQDPVYRLDGLDCQTFVQSAMGLLYSRSLNEFDQTILNISYGAAGNPSGEIIHYYNRNNFVDGDWNPINRRNGFLIDVTSKGDLAPFAATTSIDITRQNWFLFQQKNSAANVRVLKDADGSSMVSRFIQTYSTLNYPHFDAENISIAYIPKEKLALKQATGTYQPNQALLDKIPTPAVIEIVRDAKKWTIGGTNIRDVIGSELSISHMGLLYRQSFHYGDLIHQKTVCDYNDQHQKVCSVTPVVCQKEQCNELMFTHATDARPTGYYWYQLADGGYACTSELPSGIAIYTKCNRVEQEPLFDYLTEYQYGSYWYMDSPSIVGVHIEKLI